MNNEVVNLEGAAHCSEKEVGSCNNLKDKTGLFTNKRLTNSRRNKRLFFGTCATVFVAVVSVLLFYGCRKDAEVQNVLKSKGDCQQPTQEITIQTYINVGTEVYSVTGSAVAGSYDGRIFECNLTWRMPAVMHLHATLKPEFNDLTLTVEPILENYEVTINGQQVIYGSAVVLDVNGSVITIAPDDISDLWNRMVGICDANVVIKHPTTTNFDLSQFNSFLDLNIGEFHNNYLDILSNSTLFPNQTAYNQYNLLYANLTTKLHQLLDEMNISDSIIGYGTNIGLQINGFDGLIVFMQTDYPNVIPYLEQLKYHFNEQFSNNLINGEIDNSLNYFLAMRTDVMIDPFLNGQEKDIMLGILEIGAYSSVYWNNVLCADESPWLPFIMNGGDNLITACGPGWKKFGQFCLNALKICAKVTVVVSTDIGCFAAGFCVGGAITAGVGATACGTVCATAGSGAAAVGLSKW